MTIRKHDATDVKLNKYKPDGEKAKRSIRPESEWVRIQVPQIVTVPVWHETQRLLEKAKSRWRSYGTYQYMLSGLIRCGECDCSFHGSRAKKKYAYYVCSAKSPGIAGKPRCKFSNIPAELLDDTIWEHICSWILDAETLDHALSGALADEEEGKLLNELKVVITQHKDRLDERGRLVTLYQKRLLPEEELEQRIKVVNDQIKALETRQIDLEKQVESLAQGEKILLQEIKERIGERIHSLPVTERGVIVNLLIDKIIIKKDSIEAKVRAPIPPMKLRLHSIQKSGLLPQIL
jgi:site-specific DNA recombinase